MGDVSDSFGNSPSPKRGWLEKNSSIPFHRANIIELEEIVPCGGN